MDSELFTKGQRTHSLEDGHEACLGVGLGLNLIPVHLDENQNSVEGKLRTRYEILPASGQDAYQELS